MPVVTYIKKHWLGQQALAWSFWVNLVALRIVVFLVQGQYGPANGEDYQSRTPLVLALMFMLHGVLFIWQAVGVIRAADEYFAQNGVQALVWGSHLGVVLMFILSSVYVMEGWQMTIPAPADENFSERMERERASRYRLHINRETSQLFITGSIEPGITKRVKRLLEETPYVRQVVLSSDGGNIYEARGLARLFRQRSLATHVEYTCASACTVAYIGGDSRSIADMGRLGFHEYRLDARYMIAVTDAKREQYRDQQLFTDAGVNTSFINRMFKYSPDGMWWPPLTELKAAGVVNALL